MLMAYTHLLRALRGPVQHLGTQCKLRPVSFCVHTHRSLLSVSSPTFHRTTTAAPPPCALPPLTCLIQARCVSVRSSARNKSRPEDSDRSVSRFPGGTPQPSAAKKVKDAGRDFTYLIIVLVGLGVTGGLLYVVFQELFSSSSPNKIYGKTFDIVKSDTEVIGAFGEPIKCYGETTRRGRRQQVRHMEYLKDGLKHMRLKFYIEGSEPGLKGTVHAESIENNETGKYEFRYIFVEIDTYPRRTIIVEDNR